MRRTSLGGERLEGEALVGDGETGGRGAQADGALAGEVVRGLDLAEEIAADGGVKELRGELRADEAKLHPARAGRHVGHGNGFAELHDAVAETEDLQAPAAGGQRDEAGVVELGRVDVAGDEAGVEIGRVTADAQGDGNLAVAQGGGDGAIVEREDVRSQSHAEIALTVERQIGRSVAARHIKADRLGAFRTVEIGLENRLGGEAGREQGRAGEQDGKTETHGDGFEARPCAGR